MRFTRLKKAIDANPSVSIPSDPTGGTTETTLQGGTKVNPKKRKVEKPINSVDRNITAGSKIKIESLEPEPVAPSAPIKRQTRGKKIDISAGFETSPTPGARIQPRDEISDYEDAQATDEDESRGAPDGENGHEAKRRRGSPYMRKRSQPSLQRKLFSKKPSLVVPGSDLNEPASTTAAVISRPKGTILGLDYAPPSHANDNESTSPRPAPTSQNTILQTPAQPRNHPTSTRLTKFSTGYPTPPDSNNNNSGSTGDSTALHGLFATASPRDIMPLKEYDGDSETTPMD